MRSPSGGAATLAERFIAARAQTEALARPLSAEDCMVQTMPDVSPTKWHLAHTSWFFEEFVLSRARLGYAPFHPRYRYLFNSYYEAVGPRHRRPERGFLSRPSLEAVRTYRAHVDGWMRRALELASFVEEFGALVELGIQHEQQHQELILTDIKHVFSMNPLEPAYRSALADAAGAAPALAFHPFDGGLESIGHAGGSFAFDNEGPRHRVFVSPYALANRLVTNAEFLEFVADGGYETPALWLSDGWAWVQRERIRAPLYYRGDERPEAEFTLAGRRAIAPDEPVCHVSYYEADAFARWAGARLPTEAEWELAAVASPSQGTFVEDDRLHPDRAGAAPHAGPLQLFGDLWEWTASPYTPYAGYRAAAGALGEYNGKFMCNQMVLRGGSCATPRAHVRATYRNFWPPETRFQFTGIRLARDR